MSDFFLSTKTIQCAPEHTPACQQLQFNPRRGYHIVVPIDSSDSAPMSESDFEFSDEPEAPETPEAQDEDGDYDDFDWGDFCQVCNIRTLGFLPGRTVCDTCLAMR